MSHSSPSYYSAADQTARHVHPRAQSAAAISRHLHRSHDGYTLTHAGHQIRIGPVAFWIVVGTLVIMAVWSIATGSYFAFRDNVLTRLIGRQAEMQFAYEDRIAELRAKVDRIMSRQLLDQEQFEKKLNALLQRQATLEQRSSTLTGDLSTTGTIKPARIAPSAAIPAEKPVRPSPINDTVIFVAPPDREARLQSRELPASATRIAERRLRVALMACSRAFHCPSTKSSKGRRRRSPISKSASTQGPAGCKVFWPTSELMAAGHQPKGRLADRLFR